MEEAVTYAAEWRRKILSAEFVNANVRGVVMQRTDKISVVVIMVEE